ncbi:MAG: alpha-amylase, partial [Bacteroidetes bacterium]|nr:alpha-amylase [Bacteroidota bacterium]
MKRAILFGLALGGLLSSCTTQTEPLTEAEQEEMKINVYQVFTRLFGNTNDTNKPWGTLEDNGVGKFNDFSD